MGNGVGAAGVWPTVAGAFLLLAAAGSARSLLDTSGRTILIRVAPDAARGEVFGLLEGASMIALAIGSGLVPVFVAIGGPRVALIVTGGLLWAITVTAGAAVHAVDATEATAGCLRGRVDRASGACLGPRRTVARPPAR